MNYSFNVYADNDFYTNIPKDNEYLQLYEQIVGIEGIYVGEKCQTLSLAKGCIVRRFPF